MAQIPLVLPFHHYWHNTIEVDDDIIHPLQNFHDCYLMDTVVAHEQFTPKQIHLIHYCRWYLQVLTLLDITLAHGTYLDPAISQGTKSLLSSHTGLYHFRHDWPSPAAWTQWKRACWLWSQPNGQLYQPLGAWLLAPDKLWCKWPAYKDSDGSLYISTPTGYDKHSKRNGTYSVQAYQNFPVPLTSVPVTISPSLKGWEISGPISQLFQSPTTPTPGVFSDYLNALLPWESSLFHSLEMKAYPPQK